MTPAASSRGAQHRRTMDFFTTGARDYKSPSRYERWRRVAAWKHDMARRAGWTRMSFTGHLDRYPAPAVACYRRRWREPLPVAAGGGTCCCSLAVNGVVDRCLLTRVDGCDVVLARGLMARAVARIAGGGPHCCPFTRVALRAAARTAPGRGTCCCLCRQVMASWCRSRWECEIHERTSCLRCSARNGEPRCTSLVPDRKVVAWKQATWTKPNMFLTGHAGRGFIPAAAEVTAMSLGRVA
jgi:hypothetical protein